MKRILILVVAAALVAVFAVPAMAGQGPTKDKALLAAFQSWSDDDAVVHVFVFNDAGRSGVPAVVELGQPLLFGFEIVPAEGEPAPEIDVRFGGSEAIWRSASSSFIEVATGFPGPSWKWDHDNDGRGDGDGDGIGDFVEDDLNYFWRHPAAGFETLGVHAVDIRLDTEFGYIVDTITFEVVEPLG